jgi:hypothetical protein
MATVKAVVNKSIPHCPKCGSPKERNKRSDCGVSEKGFWFSYECACSTKKARVVVKYYTDGDFKLAAGG